MKTSPPLSIPQAVMVDDLNSISTMMNNLQIMYGQQQGRLNQLKAVSDPKDWAAAQAYIKWQTENNPQLGATHPATTQEQ